jgi:hypothetical protein
MKPKWLHYVQWLFRCLIILSAIISAYIVLATPYDVLPKKLYYGLGIWFFWYSVPVFIGLCALLATLWLVLRKRYTLKPVLPFIDLGFLIVYLLFYFAMQARV